MIFWHELKKILSSVALWCFIALCIIFNLWNIPSHLNNRIDTTIPFPTNVFATYDTSRIAEAYISAFGLTGNIAERMRAKYTALQRVVDENALAGYSFSPYLGYYTANMRLHLFSTFGVIGILTLQGMLLAVLLALLAIGYEQINHTEHSVYVTKTGRKILHYKIFVSLMASIGLYVLLTAITLIAYFSVLNFSGVWGSSVSSGFNYSVDIFAGVRPFTTWRNFTVASYWLASLGLSLVLVICFSLMGVIAGILLRSSYIGFLMVMVINAVLMISPLIFLPNSYIHYISNHLPLGLLRNSLWWFTDGGFITLWRNFESWGAGLSLLFLSTLCVLSIVKFRKKDVA